MRKNRYEKIPFSDELFPIRFLRNCSRDETKVLDDDSIATWHEQLEILYVCEGELEVDCGYRQYLCRPGDIVIVNPFEEHMVGYHAGHPCYHVIMIDSKLYEGGTPDLCGLKYLMPINGRRLKFNNLIRGNRKVSAILQELIEECEMRQYAFEVAVKGNILRLLAELFRSELGTADREEKLISKRDGYGAIAPVFNFIADHYNRKIKLDDLAQLCCIDASHLCRVFKKLTGKSVMEYLNEYRISKAQLLLLTTDLSIGEIAGRVGYGDGGYMTRRFKAVCGVSPGKFRDSAEGCDAALRGAESRARGREA